MNKEDFLIQAAGNFLTGDVEESWEIFQKELENTPEETSSVAYEDCQEWWCKTIMREIDNLACQFEQIYKKGLNSNKSKFKYKSFKIIRQILFFHTGETVTGDRLSKFFTDEGISEFMKFNFLKEITNPIFGIIDAELSEGQYKQTIENMLGTEAVVFIATPIETFATDWENKASAIPYEKLNSCEQQAYDIYSKLDRILRIEDDMGWSFPFETKSINGIGYDGSSVKLNDNNHLQAVFTGWGVYAWYFRIEDIEKILEYEG